jgi:hypothetical protein
VRQTGPSPAKLSPPTATEIYGHGTIALVDFPSFSTAPRLRETPQKIPNPILLFSELLRIRPGIQNGRGNLNGSAFSAVDGVEMPCLPKKDVSIGVDRASISLGVTIFLMSDFDSYGRPLRLLRPPS